MTGFLDFLAQFLPQQQQPNRLAMVNDRYGDAGNYLVDPRAALSQPSMAAPQGASVASGIDPTQTPSPAPQSAPAPSGGGIGGFLGNLFQDPVQRDRNLTAEWLVKQGEDPARATLIARDPQTLQRYLLEKTGRAQPIQINGRLVDPNSYEVLADFSDKGDQSKPITVGKDSSIYDPASGSWITPPNSSQQEKPDFGDIAGVRKEIQGLPSYKNFAQAAPIFDTMVDAASRDTKAADLNLIYGLGKIFDPNSVVREGEMVLVKDTASLPDWVIGTIQSVNGGARLQPETRTAIMKEAESRIKAYKTSLDSDFEQYTGIADRYGIKREDILPVLPAIRNLPNPGSGGGTSLPLPPPPAPVAPPAPQPTAPQPSAPSDGVLDYRDWLAPKRKR